MKWSFAAALTVCEGDVVEDDQEKDNNDNNNDNRNESLTQMLKLLVRDRRGRDGRFTDAIRAVLTFGHIGKAGARKNYSDDAAAPSEWLRLLEMCTHRVLALPDRSLQGLCFQVSFLYQRFQI